MCHRNPTRVEDARFRNDLSHKSPIVLLSVSPAAKALSSPTFLAIYLAESLFLVTCAQKTVFLPVRFALQGAKGVKPWLPQLVFMSQHSAVGFEVLGILGDGFCNISTPCTADLVVLRALIKSGLSVLDR